MNLRRLGARGRRTSGPPVSANRASSLHLRWELPPRHVPDELVEVAATLEVLVAPTVPRLYFWALQASFSAGSSGGFSSRGAGHLGLQRWGERPPGRYVNWGGYACPHDGGGVLAGTGSALPSSLGNDHTRDYPWLQGRPYRLGIRLVTAGVWRGEVTDLVAGRTTVVRDLACPGHHLTEPMVWSEVFADCDHPSTTVRWSGLEALTASGERVTPRAVVVSYQSFAEGGCDNTTALPDREGVLQVTAAPRRLPQGSRLAL